MDLKSLNQIFNKKFFRIPDYQRGYSWKETHLEDFWNDIKNIRNGRIHYTGLLTVERISDKEIKTSEKWEDDRWLIEKDFKGYYVIDGQQRLTTSIILIQLILEEFENEEYINKTKISTIKDDFLYQQFKNYKSYIFGYEKDDPSDEFFKTYILKQKSLAADKFPEKTLYTSNLKFARNYFKDKLNELNKEEIAEIFRKLTSSLKYNYYEIDNELDVFVTFETMNNRGKDLTNLELLKNRLIYLTTLLDDESESDKKKLRNEINEVWKTVYEYLGKNEENPLSDDVFLRNHWIVYFKYNRDVAKAYEKFLLHEYFTTENILEKNTEYDINFEKIRKYITSISDSVKAWYYLFNVDDSDFDDNIKEYIKKLKRLNFGAFRPLIMALFVKKMNESNNNYDLEDSEKVEQFLKEAERFVFLVFNISNRQSNTQNSYFYSLAHSFYFGKNDIDYLIKEVNKKTEKWFNINLFKTYIDDLFNKRKGFYSWKGLNYFLFEYELHLNSQTQEDMEINWQQIKNRKKDKSIEHILPRTVEDIKYWEDLYGDFSKKEREILSHSLGNLILISSKKNSSMKNRPFPEKKRRNNNVSKFKSYRYGTLSERELMDYKDWSADKILSRGLKLFNFLEKRWKIEFGEDVEKIEILQLDFLK
ncbi:MAG: DUF262 domain-containing protein [Candidatus Woesearchaeota archaeon]